MDSTPFLIVALAGLPGSGKSTLARELARELGCPLFDKDLVRTALFDALGDGVHVAHTREQDDLIVSLLFDALRWTARGPHAHAALLDGRTWVRARQQQQLTQLARELHATLRVIHCQAPLSTLLARVESDRAARCHVAHDRDAALVLRLWHEAEPLALPHLALDTAESTLEDTLRRALAYVREVT